jgi:DNA polymerase III epsilon subunit-like protein
MLDDMNLWYELPALLVGFDIESTGLDTEVDEPISYGFAIYRNGELVEEEEFFALPSVAIHPAAEKVHGWSRIKLEELHAAGDAHSAVAGVARAAQRLREFHVQGAHFVGAYPEYDFRMTTSLLRRHSMGDLEVLGFDLATVRLIDVCQHDRRIDTNRTRRRSLTALSEHYRVTPGNHTAIGDAKAAVEVLKKQVEYNQTNTLESSIAALRMPANTTSPAIRQRDGRTY